MRLLVMTDISGVTAIFSGCYVRVEICGALTVLKDSVDGTKPGELTAVYAEGQWLRCWMEPEEEKASG